MVAVVIALVVALLALVGCAVRLRALGQARTMAVEEAAAARQEAATAALEAERTRTLADEATASASAAEAAQQQAAEARASAEARTEVEAGRAEAAQAQAREAQERADGAEAALRASTRPWTDALWALERCRVERTWHAVAPVGEAMSVTDDPTAALRQGLEVELQWLREVVGTPGRLHSAGAGDGSEGDDPASAATPAATPAAGVAPAALVALRLAQEALDCLAKRSEDLEVTVTAQPEELEVRVVVRDLDDPPDPDGHLARLSGAVGVVGGRVEVDSTVDPAVVRLVVPTGATSAL